MRLFSFWWRRAWGTSFLPRKQGPIRFRPCVEQLEEITLLSSSAGSIAYTTYVRSIPTAQASPLDGATPGGLSPATIRNAYGFNQLALDGTGQTIAIVDAYDDPNIVSDLHAFDQHFGLSDPSFTKVSQTGSTTALPSANSGWAMEISLDVEWAHVLAPGGKILLVEANDANTTNLFTAATYAAKQSGVTVVSMSFGTGEYSTETTDDSTFQGHTGVTFVAAAGDAGSPASFPAYSPYVVSVGGTTLSVNGSGAYASESAWSGTGGGISKYEAKPSYQSALSYSKRAVPDVAFDADPNSGVPVYDSYSPGGSSDPYNPDPPWTTIGGTSFAAPSWAAIFALTDQARAQAGLAPLTGATQTLPALYALPSSDFHDVTTGGNNKYQAGPGYDLVTGLGSPVVNLIVPDLSGTIRLTASPGNADITLSWTAASGASSYNVYRGTSPGGESTTAFATGVSGTSFTNTGLTNGTTYYYTVTALNAAGQSLTKSNEASATPVAPPVAVTNLVASGAYSQVTLSWTAAAGATSYDIYRGTSPNGEAATAVATVTGTTDVDLGLTDGTTYYYEVTAANAGGQSPRSTEVSAAPRIAAPTGLVATPGAVSVTLLWAASPGASSYKVYRGTTPGGEAGTAVATVTSGTSFSDTGLTLGTTYYYEVTAIDSGGESVRSSEISTTTVLDLNASIWSAATTPVVADANDASSVNVGVKFSAAVSGYITGIRFYKGDTSNGGTHIGDLWSANGTLLASATFTAESASGWQQVNFATPVAITANTTYIASYFAPDGHYANDGAYFASAGVTNGVLSALSNGVAGGNGVYAYGSSSAFPNSTYNSSNYWVDVVFSNVLVPSVVSETPASGTTQVATTSSISVTFNQSVLANSISFVLYDSSNNAVAATVSYNDSTHTATLQPNAALAANTTYTAIVSAATNSGGVSMSAPVSWSFTTAGPIVNATIWSAATTPVDADANDPSSVNVGVKFSSTVSGYITGIRFYKGDTSNGGTHIGDLWSANGTLLASATFTAESASGWQQVNFATPVAITANTTYIASYFAPDGHYANDGAYFASAGVTNGVLSALSNGVAGGNGVYAYGSSSAFPNSTYNSSNYWVDVVFSNVLVPSVVSETPASGTTQVATTSSISVTFNQSVLANSISFVLYDSSNNAVAATVSYNDSTHTATLQPNAALAANTTYTAIVSAATNSGGVSMSAPVSWSFTTAGPIVNATIWSAATTPVDADANDPSSVEIGVKFSSTVSGYITGIRFYKGDTSNGGTHIGDLWSANGTLLASATFTAESASGWQQVNFATPVAITANTTYIASYFAPDGHYANDGAYFASAGVTNGVLSALSNAAAGGNGVYAYGSSSSFPNGTYNSSNYWVDVVFSSSAPADPSFQRATVADSSAKAPSLDFHEALLT